MIARLLLLSGLLAGMATPADAPRETLLVLSKGDHTLAVVDPSTLKVLGKAPVGEDPHEVIPSSDGKTAYASNYGGGAYNTLARIDLVNIKAQPSIDLGALRGPHGLFFAGGKVWFTAEAAKAAARFDPASEKIDWIIGTGQNRTHMLFVTADMQQVFTTNISSATVSILSRSSVPQRTGPPREDWNATVIPVGPGDEGFDVSPDGRELWTANAQDGTVSVIDLQAKKVVATLPANVQTANRLKFSPDGKLVVISALRSPTLAVIDAHSRKEVKRVPVGHGAAGLQMQPDGSRLYAACTPDNYVAVIDLKTLEITGRIDAGPQPDGLAWSVRQ